MDALLEKDFRRAKERLEEISKEIDLSDEFWRGYRLALQGMIAALETGDELTVIRRIVNGRYSPEDLRRFIGEVGGRISNAFRPKDEQGFYTAWRDVLQIISPTQSTLDTGAIQA